MILLVQVKPSEKVCTVQETAVKDDLSTVFIFLHELWWKIYGCNRQVQFHFYPTMLCILKVIKLFVQLLLVPLAWNNYFLKIRIRRDGWKSWYRPLTLINFSFASLSGWKWMQLDLSIIGLRMGLQVCWASHESPLCFSCEEASWGQGPCGWMWLQSWDQGNKSFDWTSCATPCKLHVHCPT